MRTFFRISFWALLSAGAAFSQQADLRLEVITHLNTASQFWVENDTIIAATSGGLLIYDLAGNQSHTFTCADGIYDHYLNAAARGKGGLAILGSLSGNLSFLNPGERSVSNDENLKGTEIIDLAAIEDTLWVLSKNFVSAYLYDSQKQKYQFRESYQSFGVALGDFRAIEYANGRIWLANDAGLLSAPANFLKYNLYAASNWRLQTTLHGLPGNTITDIAKTETPAALYLATNRGLSVYDFNTFTNIIAGLLVQGLTEVAVRNGAVYVADPRRVYRLQNNQFERLFTLTTADITDLSIAAGADIWVSTVKRGLYNLTQSRQLLIDGPLDNYTGEVYMDSRRQLWCTGGILGDEKVKGLFVQTTRGWQNYYFTGGNNNRYYNFNSSNPIFEDAGQNIWVGSWGGGLVVFDKDMNIHPINNLTDPGQVWISSVEGEDTVTVQTAPELQTIVYPVVSTVDYTVITDIDFDPLRQSIWVLNYAASTLAPLIEYKADRFDERALNPNSWKHFSGAFSKNELNKITQDPFGDLWISATEGVFQVRMKGDTLLGPQRYQESDNLKINATTAIAGDQDGYVWVGTKSGLNAILNQVVYDFRETYQPIGLKINDIFVDSRNNKWFATDRGVSILKSSGSPFDPNSWIDIVPPNSSITPEQLALRANVFVESLPSEVVHSVFLDDATGDVYMGSVSGIAVIRNNPFTSPFKDYAQLKVGPNPFILGDGSNTPLTFYNLAPGSEVKILTMNGQLVRTLDPKNFNENKGAMAQWDGRTQEGKYVATGVYLFLISNEEGQDTAGKILVVRK